MPGPPKKPRKLKLLSGTFKASREVEREPEFEGEVDINPPKDMEGVALLTWQELAPLLRNAGVLKRVDTRALESYCYAWANFQAATALVNRDGVVLETDDGIKKNPALSAQLESLRELRQLSAVLGLDPASRGRINVGKKQKTTSFGDVAKKATR